MKDVKKSFINNSQLCVLFLLISNICYCQSIGKNQIIDNPSILIINNSCDKRLLFFAVSNKIVGRKGTDVLATLTTEKIISGGIATLMIVLPDNQKKYDYNSFFYDDIHKKFIPNYVYLNTKSLNPPHSSPFIIKKEISLKSKSSNGEYQLIINNNDLPFYVRYANNNKCVVNENFLDRIIILLEYISPDTTFIIIDKGRTDVIGKPIIKDGLHRFKIHLKIEGSTTFHRLATPSAIDVLFKDGQPEIQISEVLNLSQSPKEIMKPHKSKGQKSKLFIYNDIESNPDILVYMLGNSNINNFREEYTVINMCKGYNTLDINQGLITFLVFLKNKKIFMISTILVDSSKQIVTLTNEGIKHGRK